MRVEVSAHTKAQTEYNMLEFSNSYDVLEHMKFFSQNMIDDNRCSSTILVSSIRVMKHIRSILTQFFGRLSEKNGMQFN